MNYSMKAASCELDGCLYGLVDHVAQRLGEPIDCVTHRYRLGSSVR
jgi:hypothetical protein